MTTIRKEGKYRLVFQWDCGMYLIWDDLEADSKKNKGVSFFFNKHEARKILKYKKNEFLRYCRQMVEYGDKFD